MRTELVLDGLRLAIAQRRPAPGLVWRSITAASSTLGDMLNLRGVDVDRVKDELQSFVPRTEPRNASGDGVLGLHSDPACGREQALAL